MRPPNCLHPVLMAALCLIAAPAFAQPAAPAAPTPQEEAAEYTEVRMGHGTCATAVALAAEDHLTGVERQYEWLRKHHPGHALVDQALIDCNGKPTDVMAMSNAENKTYFFVYFDLSGYFGKGMGL